MKTCCGQTFDLRGYSAHLDKEHVEDPDFESLLETEPAPELVPTVYHTWAPNDAGGYSPLEVTTYQTPKSALSSAADRIKDLERVLVGIRRLAGTARSGDEARLVLGHIIRLANETLDPCKPWCVLEPGHQGACSTDSMWDGDDE